VIVVDTNVLAYLLLDSEFTQPAQRVFLRDFQWSAPFLWRSEFRSVLGLYLRRDRLSLEESLEVMQKAEQLMQGKEYQVASDRVLNLAAASRCSAYDCEFVALAQDMGLPLVTFDRAVLAAFPSTAISPYAFSP
jgi:predicted nucleic acid-binding protein